MKALTALLMAITATLFFACNVPTTNTAAQLKDETQRKAIIGELVANHDYTTQLMDAMMASDHAKQMMMSDDHMMKMMKDTAMHNKMMSHMMGMMEKDTAMCRNMCSKMMDNPKMKTMMQDMMKHHGEGMKHQEMKMPEKTK
jgi:Na+-translocating ferredoxin:NAD+ oxidoreductase RnfG subunit